MNNPQMHLYPSIRAKQNKRRGHDVYLRTVGDARRRIKRDLFAFLYGASLRTIQSLQTPPYMETKTSETPMMAATPVIVEVSHILECSILHAASIVALVSRFLFQNMPDQEIVTLLRDVGTMELDETDVAIAGSMDMTEEEYITWTYELIVAIVKDSREKFLLRQDIKKLQEEMAASKTVGKHYDQLIVDDLESSPKEFARELMERLGLAEKQMAERGIGMNPGHGAAYGNDMRFVGTETGRFSGNASHMAAEPRSEGNAPASPPNPPSLKERTLPIVEIDQLHTAWEYVDNQRDVMLKYIEVARMTLPGDPSYHEALRMVRQSTVEYLRGTDHMLVAAEHIAASRPQTAAQGVANGASRG